MNLWRISEFADLSGRGGLLSAGRWHDRGVPVIYCSDHPSTALLEIMVHLDLEDMPRDFQLLKIAVPDDISIATIDCDAAQLGGIDWTRQEGHRMLEKGDVCLIKVPSAIMPEAINVLINPRHPQAASLTIERIIRYPFDSRLFP